MKLSQVFYVFTLSVLVVARPIKRVDANGVPTKAELNAANAQLQQEQDNIAGCVAAGGDCDNPALDKANAQVSAFTDAITKAALADPQQKAVLDAQTKVVKTGDDAEQICFNDGGDHCGQAQAAANSAKQDLNSAIAAIQGPDVGAAQQNIADLKDQQSQLEDTAQQICFNDPGQACGDATAASQAAQQKVDDAIAALNSQGLDDPANILDVNFVNIAADLADSDTT